MASQTAGRQGWAALGRLLKESRESKGWSIRDLIEKFSELDADVPRVSVSAISNIERGNVEPKVSTLLALIDFEYIKDPETGELMGLEDVCNYVRKNGGAKA